MYLSFWQVTSVKYSHHLSCESIDHTMIRACMHMHTYKFEHTNALTRSYLHMQSDNLVHSFCLLQTNNEDDSLCVKVEFATSAVRYYNELPQ